MEIDDIVQVGEPERFTPPVDAIKLKARILKVRDCKVDLQIYPQRLYKTYLGLLRTKGMDVYKLPFETFIMDYVVKKAKENMRLKAHFKGVYNPPTPPAVSTTVDTMNGFLKLVQDEITATNITPIATGVITQVNVIDALEQVHDGLDEVYQYLPTKMFVSPAIFRMYTKAYRDQYGANTDYKGMDISREVMLDGRDCIVCSEPGLAGSQRVICSPKDNFVYGTDSTSDVNKIIIEKEKRALNILIDWRSGVQFAQIAGNCLAVNNQA